MTSANDGGSEGAHVTEASHTEAVHEARARAPSVVADQPAPADQQATSLMVSALPPPAPPRPPAHPLRRWLLLGGAVVGVAAAAYFLVPWFITMLNTVSTDDAYVNGHVTFVAPRVAGQVTRVLVDDNMRVKKGALLVQLDKEPYQVQVDIKKSAVQTAEANLVAARAQVIGLEALARSQRWQLELAMEQVATQIANLRASEATYQSKKATLDLARANLKRGEKLAPSGGISKEDLDSRRREVKVAEAAVDAALQAIYAIRVGLGLPERPPAGHDLAEVPPNIEQTYSGVRTALAKLVQTMAQIGLPLVPTEATPKQVLEEFRKRNVKGDIDRILAELVPKAPAVKQAEANLAQARADLAQAELNLRYTDIVSEIDGQVTRRNVNPGNNVAVGQSLMAVRSLTEIWIDANFKETQLADLRIGQRAKLEIDMYGSRYEFEGRISGFTMGTGQTLSLLPPQNATGNFVKIVQRLPVRIEVMNYDPEHRPLFVGLSVTPYVYFKEEATGPDAGKFLQPLAPLPQLPVNPLPNNAMPPGATGHAPSGPPPGASPRGQRGGK
jgi:membrane fusion protein (multidrug efflux system)